MLRLAWLGARAHRLTLAGTGVVVALAAALLSMTGAVVQTATAHPDTAGLLFTLAGSFSGTGLLVIVIVVAVTVSLSLRQRRREFALLLATGATRRQLRRIIGLEVALLTLVTAPIGAVAGLLAAPHVLTPMLVHAQIVPTHFHLDLQPWPVLAATVILLPITLLAARLAARETMRIAPSVAVRESTVEPHGLSRTRRVSAAVLAAAGLPVALTPVFVPGIEGSAAAAVSAFLLIGAAALAGPLVIGWLFDRTVGWQARTAAAPVRLALANSRGFARRLTTVIVPLAVALAVGTVQTGVNRSVEVASKQQLTAGIHADLAVTAAAGLSAGQLRTIAHTPGVRASEVTTTAPAQVKTDDEAPSALAWEYTSLRTLPATDATLVDPKVTSGSLTALAKPDSIAISADARTDIGGGLGHRVTVRSPGGAERTLTVVAIYDRGLAFGGYLVAPATLRALAPEAQADTILLRTAPNAAAATADRLRDLGLDVRDKQSYAAWATSTDAAVQHLSATLLLSLLVFVGLAAANTLLLTTVARRRELDLLRRTGATRRQLVAMTGVESLIVSVTAWVIGSLAVVPALMGVNYGLTGTPALRIDVPAYLLLSAAVALVPLVCTVPTVSRLTRTRRAARTAARPAQLGVAS